jgi:exodeoxyribonuclease VII large subunit
VNAHVLPVGVFVCLLRETLESDRFYADLWLEGEITDLSRSGAGHVYFNLRDADGCLKCVMFRGQALRQPRPPRIGERVGVHGMLSIYPGSGSLQLVVDLVRPAGIGLASLELEYLRQRLESEGLFDERRKRPLPILPSVIGVVTSEHGAAWHDIQTVIGRRYPLASLLLAPAHVQGPTAATSIAQALAALQSDGRAEVIILARGGGASDDLSAFNDERVVRAVFGCAVPVVTGIGHATDRTLVEDAADLSAPTPSAAAEMAAPSVLDLAERVWTLRTWLGWHAAAQWNRAEAAASEARRRFAAVEPKPAVARHRTTIANLSQRLHASATGRVAEGRRETASAEALLRTLDPEAVLRRGYAALSEDPGGQPLFRATSTAPGAGLVAVLADGTLRATVDRVVPIAPILGAIEP